MFSRWVILVHIGLDSLYPSVARTFHAIVVIFIIIIIVIIIIIIIIIIITIDTGQSKL